jgi:excisionase family DNA binding protein
MIILQFTADELRAIIRDEVRAAVGQPANDFVSTREMAARLGLHEKTLARLVRTEGCPARRLGNKYSFKQADVAAWLDGRRKAG